MKSAERVLALIAAGLAMLAYLRGGWGLWFKGLTNTANALTSAAWLLVLAFAISGLMEVLVPPSTIRKWLGGESGLRGVTMGCLVGALTPGGPYVYYPIALALYRAGAGTGTLMAYIAGKAIWDLPRLPLEIGLFGTRFAVIRLTVTLFVPLAAGLLGNRFFGNFRARAKEGGAS